MTAKIGLCYVRSCSPERQYLRRGLQDRSRRLAAGKEGISASWHAYDDLQIAMHSCTCDSFEPREDISTLTQSSAGDAEGSAAGEPGLGDSAVDMGCAAVFCPDALMLLLAGGFLQRSRYNTSMYADPNALKEQFLQTGAQFELKIVARMQRIE